MCGHDRWSYLVFTIKKRRLSHYFQTQCHRFKKKKKKLAEKKTKKKEKESTQES